MVERFGNKQSKYVKSAREYEAKEAEGEKVNSIAEKVRYSCSAKNTQPWKLNFISGNILAKLKEALCDAFDKGEPFTPDFNQDLLPIYKSRAVDLGKRLFIYKNIAKEDKEARRKHDRLNFEFFNAPQIFLLSTEKIYNETTLIDLGIFTGTLIEAIHNENLSCCVQASVVNYPQIFREIIPDLKEEKIVLAIPFGYPLENSRINAFDAGRLETDLWFRIFQ